MEESKNEFNLGKFFFNRTGINYFRYYDTDIIIYEDHRTILNILFVLYKTNYLSKENIPNIISFDLHDDCFDGLKQSEIFEILKVKSFDDINIKDFWSFVEFDCSGLDNDWVKTAMELNMINDYVNIGGIYIDRLKDNQYISENKKKHYLHSLKHLDFELSETNNFIGQLQNINNSTNEIRKLFGYNFDVKNDFSENQQPYILDFDLDCFTMQSKTLQDVYDNEPLSCIWDEKLFKSLYYGFHDDFINKFMKCLIRRSEIVTICIEPFYCGGYKESAKILEYLDKYLFEGKLKTATEWK